MWTQETLIYTNLKKFSVLKSSFMLATPLKFHSMFGLKDAHIPCDVISPKTTQVWKIRLNLPSVRELYGFIPHYTCFLTHMQEEQYHWVLSLKPGFERRSPLSKSFPRGTPVLMAAVLASCEAFQNFPPWGEIVCFIWYAVVESACLLISILGTNSWFSWFHILKVPGRVVDSFVSFKFSEQETLRREYQEVILTITKWGEALDV